MVYYGQGFTHSDVYNMPVYLRNFYNKKLLSTKKEENKEAKKVQRKSKIPSRAAINPRFKR